MQQVLLVGVNDLTELYLSSVAEFAPAKLAVVGILSRGRGLHGRFMRQYKVLGSPEDISRVLAQLELHGITVDRIVVMQAFEQLSRTAQEALLEVERASAIKVEWLLETFLAGVEPKLASDPLSIPRFRKRSCYHPPTEDDDRPVSLGWLHLGERA